MDPFECYACKQVSLFTRDDQKTCPVCGSSNGKVISGERVIEGLEAGTYFPINPKTGKRAKKSKRR